MLIIAITVAALAAMLVVLVVAAGRIERKRQTQIELALLDRIAATPRRRRTEAEINAAWGKTVDKVRLDASFAQVAQMRKARDSQYQRDDGTTAFCLAAASSYPPARTPADDCRMVGMDMATAADETAVTLGAAILRVTTSDTGVCFEPVSSGDVYQCATGSDAGSYSPSAD